MDKDFFWQVIDNINKKAQRNDHYDILQNAGNQLMQYPASDIADWKNIFQYYKGLAERNIVYAAAIAINGYVSDDGFIDFRAWLISQGRVVYMNAMRNPDSLADVDIEGESAFFETFSYIADYAYSKKAFIEKEGADAIYKSGRQWFAANGNAFVDQIFNSLGVRHRAPEQVEVVYNSLYSHIRKVLSKNDIWDEMKKRPLSKTRQNEIKGEIVFAPDIKKGWKGPELKCFLPKLYEKYHLSEVTWGD
jgi:hypothetical protein